MQANIVERQDHNMSHDDREESLYCQPCNDAGADVDMLAQGVLLVTDFAVDVKIISCGADRNLKQKKLLSFPGTRGYHTVWPVIPYKMAIFKDLEPQQFIKQPYYIKYVINN